MDALQMLKEKTRLTKDCAIECVDCRLHRTNNDMHSHYEDLLRDNPEIYVEIIEQWSKDCPEHTYLSKLLEAFPDTEVRKIGSPKFCPSKLGQTDSQYMRNIELQSWLILILNLISTGRKLRLIPSY